MEDQGISGKQMEVLLTALAKLNREQQQMFMEGLKSFATELRKPTEAEQAKLDKEKADLARKLQTRIAVAKAEQQRADMLKTGCSHADPNGKHAWRTQVNQDGFFRPLCVICKTVLPPIKATHEQIMEGVNLELYPSMNMDMLEKWSSHTQKSA